MGNQHTTQKKVADLEQNLRYYQGLAAAVERERDVIAETLIAVQERDEKEQEAKAAAEEAAKKTRFILKVTVMRLDGTVDEFIQALPRMADGETFTVAITPSAK